MGWLSGKGSGEQIEVNAEPERQFRPDGLYVPLPKWARACNWTSKDDAMLLLGVYWCGYWTPSSSPCGNADSLGGLCSLACMWPLLRC